MKNLKITKPFLNGRKKAIRLPKEVTPNFELQSWNTFFEEVPLPSKDFLEERIDPPPQYRKELL